MKEIKAKWGSHIVEAYHQVLLCDEPCYTEFNGVIISNVHPVVAMENILMEASQQYCKGLLMQIEAQDKMNYGRHKNTDHLSRPA